MKRAAITIYGMNDEYLGLRYEGRDFDTGEPTGCVETALSEIESSRISAMRAVLGCLAEEGYEEIAMPDRVEMYAGGE